MQWRAIIGIALFGAIISLIVGIAAGNPFGIILLRTLVSAFLFGGLGIGILLVAKRFLPGLLSESPQEGMSVDIVIDDEVETAIPELDAEEGLKEPEPVDGSNLDLPETSTMDVTAEEETETAFVQTDEVEEIAPILELDGEEESYPGAVESESAVLDEVPLEELQSQELVDDQPFSSTSKEGVDTLPEMGSLDGFEAAGSSAGLDEFEQAEVEGMEGQDAETLAKAIRTVMKRDEGG